MKTLSGSTRIRRPTWKLPAVSHSQAVEGSERASGDWVWSFAKTTTAAAKEPSTELVAIYPAALREMPVVPSNVISSAAASGATRQIQAATITWSPTKEAELVDIEVEPLLRNRDDQA